MCNNSTVPWRVKTGRNWSSDDTYTPLHSKQTAIITGRLRLSRNEVQKPLTEAVSICILQEQLPNRFRTPPRCLADLRQAFSFLSIGSQIFWLLEE